VGLKGFFAGLLIALCISACGSIPFLYKFYVFDYENNMLLGPKPQDDLKTEVCSKASDNKYKCVVMKIDDFYSLKTDYEIQKQKIIKLERELSQCR
jgi:hypothetical protein